MDDFPSLKCRQMLAILERNPLRYAERPGRKRKGSHRKLESPNGFPPIGFWCHDKDTLRGSVVREILVKQVGLSEADAHAATRGKLS